MPLLFSMWPTLALSAVIDTLEDIGPNGAVVTSRLIGGIEVTIDAGANAGVYANTYFDPSLHYFSGPHSACGSTCNDPLDPTNVSGNRFIGGYPDGTPTFENRVPSYTFEFSSNLSGFGLTTIDLLENNGGDTDWITLTAYNSLGAILDTQTRIGDQGPSGLDLDWYVSSANPDIAKAVLTSSISDFGGHGIDDLLVETVAVPIPSAFYFFAVSLLNVAALKRVLPTGIST